MSGNHCTAGLYLFRGTMNAVRRLGWPLLPIVIALVACGRTGVPSTGDDDDDVASTPTPAPSPSATATLPAEVGDLVLNEVYTFIGDCSNVECDANRSGNVNGGADQFVEIVNIASGPRSLAGIGIHEKDG